MSAVFDGLANVAAMVLLGLLCWVPVLAVQIVLQIRRERREGKP